MGMAVGLVAGVAAGLLTAPMRGADMRANLRSRADNALDRGMMLLEEGRRAFRTGQSAAADTTPGALTATLGEIAQMHSGDGLSTTEARS
jgi:gas vesicle protein